jgi:hypothetical protein
VDVEREGVVAPRHVLQALDDPAVVLRVDVGLLAVVGPRVRPGGTQARVACRRQVEQRAPRLALAQPGVGDVQPAPRADLDLAGDELAGDRLREEPAGRVAQLLEARRHVQRHRVEDRELLFDPHGAVGRGREALGNVFGHVK